jgi:hypothetical protein
MNMANLKPRVNIPVNVAQRLQLAARIYAKHQELGSASPLTMLQSNSWASNGPVVSTAQGFQREAEELQRKLEQAYEQRDLLLAKIDESIKASRDALLAVYRDNPRALGDWGFTIDDTPRSTKTKPA